MNIMIVEDEVEILKGIQEVIELSRLPFERVMAVHTAEEALELIERYRPDIILTDILLPEMSGLDMLESAIAEGYRPKVIVISSYSNFAYAQRSIQLGAADYILKPVRREDLAEKVAAVYEIVEREQADREQLKSQTVYAQLGTEALQERFIQGLCLQRTALQEHIHHRLQMWNLQWLELQSYVLISLSANRADSGAAGKPDKDLHLEQFAIGNIADEVLNSFSPSAMIRSIHHDWVILTAWENELDVAEEIRAKVHAYQKMMPGIGISDRMHAFQAISEAYEQARSAMKVATLGGCEQIVRYADIIDRIGHENGRVVSALVAEGVLEGNAEEVDRWTEHTIRRFMIDKDVSTAGDMSVKCFEWMLEVHASLTEKIDVEISHHLLEFWEKAERCTAVDDLLRLSKGHLAELMQLVAGQQPPSTPHYIIDKAKRIIDEKYGEAITLQSVAGELSIHPVWLSRLFKKETGHNFLEYVTDIRIDNAKHMLRNTSYKIYEIAEKIGYQEIQYFGRLFKKRTNMTPKEYRYGK